MNKIIIIALILSLCFIVYQTKSKNDLKAEYEAYKQNTTITIRETLNANKRQITDSLHAVYHSFNDSTLQSLINKENEKTIDSLRTLNDNEFENYLQSIERRYGLRD